MATPLAIFVARFGGYTGTVIDQLGNKHSVSLERWRRSDPETTRIVLRCNWRPLPGRKATKPA